MKSFFLKFWYNLLRVFSRKNLPWHLLAIFSTYAFVASGFDWFYYTKFSQSFFAPYLFPAVVIGGIMPIILPIILYAWARSKNISVLKNTALAVVQAGIMGSFVSSLYKAFTGRIQPPIHLSNLVDISRDFNFGFWRHGIFWGWPSSHTTIAFAIAVTVFILYRKNRALGYSALLLALYIGIGVSISIHWFSDFNAGVIIGSVIGVAVGNSFLNMSKDADPIAELNFSQ